MEFVSNDIKYVEKYYTCRNHKIFYKHFNKNAPTVIFEAGLGDGSQSWNYIQDRISQIASTFSYDRIGCGKSDKSLISRTCLDIVCNLREILTTISTKPPYILVGHSFGGLVVRLFANIYPELVFGVVLVDAIAENKEIHYEKILTEKHLLKNREYFKNPMLNAEKIDKEKSYNQISENNSLYNIPLTIIMRGLADDNDLSLPNDKILRMDQELQSNMQNLSTRSKIRIAHNSRHFIQNDEPEIVIEEIKNMLISNDK